MELEIYDLFKNLLPEPSTETIENLEKDILKRGIIEPIVIWNGKIVDGHHRYQIAKKYKIDFNTKELINISTIEDVCKWIIEHQLAKRNLKLIDKVNLSLNYADLLKKSEPDLKDSTAIDLTVKIFDLKKSTFQKYKAIKESGNEKLLNFIINEEKSIDDTYKKYLKWKQTKHRKNQPINKNGEGLFHNENCFNYMKDFNNRDKFNIIITQTPTSCDTDILKKIQDKKVRVGYCASILKKTLTALESVTKKDCFYFFIINVDDYLPFLEIIKEHLFYMSTLVWNTAFTKVYTEPYKLNNTYKFIVMACKGYEDGININKCNDHIESIKSNRKGIPINVIDYLLKIVETDNSYVFDPFAGYGSVISAALLRKLKVEGCELNRDIYQMACNYIEEDKKILDSYK